MLREKRFHKLLGIERQQIACFLSDTYIPHWQSQFARDGDYDSAFGGAVEFG
jgi:hypothetical protein